MSIRSQLEEYVVESGHPVLFADGFDDALVGYVERFCSEGPVLVALYDRNMCIDILIHQGLTHEEADEHFNYNVIGAYVGPGTPAFMTSFLS